MRKSGCFFYIIWNVFAFLKCNVAQDNYFTLILLYLFTDPFIPGKNAVLYTSAY